MKILFFLAVWKRPQITEICFMGLNRLKRFGSSLAVISEQSMVPLCNKYGINWVFHENQPLGKKKNFGLTEAFKMDWDFMIELGSDDVIKDELMEVYKPHFQSSNMMTARPVCYINSVDMDCRISKSSTMYGMGRAFERSALEKASSGVEIIAEQDLISTSGRSTQKGGIGFFPHKDAKQLEAVGYAKIVSEEKNKIWRDDQVKGLDNYSTFFLLRNGVMGKQVYADDPIGIDIKSEENIWPFHDAIGEPYDLDKCLAGLSDDEKTAIKSLKK